MKPCLCLAYLSKQLDESFFCVSFKTVGWFGQTDCNSCERHKRKRIYLRFLRQHIEIIWLQNRFLQVRCFIHVSQVWQNTGVLELIFLCSFRTRISSGKLTVANDSVILWVLVNRHRFALQNTESPLLLRYRILVENAALWLHFPPITNVTPWQLIHTWEVTPKCN